MSAEEKNTEVAKGAVSVVSILEKPWLFAWTLRLIIVTVFLDIVVVVTGQNGLINEGLTVARLTNPSFVLLTLCAFGLFVCLAAPASFYFLKVLVWPYLPTLDKHKPPDFSQGYISAHEVRFRALITENEFWLHQYQEHERIQGAGRRAADTLAPLLWTVFVLFLIELYLYYFSLFSKTEIVPFALTILGGGVILPSIILGLVILVGVWLCLETRVHDSPMYCPPFAREEYQKQLDRNQRDREFRELIRMEHDSTR